MIDHRDWVDHLKNHCAALGGRVFDLAQFTRDAGGWKTLPAAYVYPVSDMAGEGYATLNARQSVVVTMAVLIVVRASGTAEQKLDSLATVRNAVNAAMQGWQPPNCFDTVNYVGGQSEEYINSDLIWEDRYASRYLLTP
jgi:hypothetical protein